jgi:hypothetical protein
MTMDNQREQVKADLATVKFMVRVLDRISRIISADWSTAVQRLDITEAGAKYGPEPGLLD